MFLCNNSALQRDDKNATNMKGTGDSTEIALKLGCVNVFLSFQGQEWSDFCYKLNEFAFDSDRKMISVLCKTTPSSTFSGIDRPFGFVLVKEAPEMLLQKCSYYLKSLQTSQEAEKNDSSEPKTSTSKNTSNSVKTIDGQSALLEPINNDFFDTVLEQNSSMPSNGLRVFGLAYKAHERPKNGTI